MFPAIRIQENVQELDRHGFLKAGEKKIFEKLVNMWQN